MSKTLTIMPGEPITRVEWVQLSAFMREWLLKNYNYVHDPNPAIGRLVVLDLGVPSK